jgi:hypothetical protein
MLEIASVRPPFVLFEDSNHRMFCPPSSRLPPLDLSALPPLDASILPTFPLETTHEIVFLYSYPPLPPPTPQEIDALAQVSEQSDEMDEETAWKVPPGLEPYSGYTGTVYYATLGGNQVYIHEFAGRQRFEVQRVFSVFVHLRSKLHANLLLLRRHGEAGLANAPSHELDVFG